jgi:hypothetical protein
MYVYNLLISDSGDAPSKTCNLEALAARIFMGYQGSSRRNVCTIKTGFRIQQNTYIMHLYIYIFGECVGKKEHEVKEREREERAKNNNTEQPFRLDRISYSVDWGRLTSGFTGEWKFRQLRLTVWGKKKFLCEFSE